MSAYRKVRAVVLTDDLVFYDSKPAHPLKESVDISDLRDVVGGAGRVFGRGGEGVILVDRKAADLTFADSLEWAFTEVRTWTTFTGPDRTVVHLGCLGDMFAEGGRPGPLLDGTAVPITTVDKQTRPKMEYAYQDMADRLGRYHEVTGTPWRVTAGVTGCAMMRRAYMGRKVRQQPLWHSPGPRGMRGAGPLIWRAQQAAELPADGMVQVFDINAMYLAGLKNASLAWGRLEPFTGAFSPAYPGFWEVEAGEIPAGLYDGKLRPPVFPAGLIHKGSAWLTTPVLKYLADLGVTPTIIQAMISPNGETLARPVAEQLITARTELVDGDARRVLPAIKRTYTELVGMMAREGGSIYRPDWSATIMDLSRMNMFRRLDRAAVAGFHPLAIYTDGVYFLGDTAPTELCAALGTGTGPGTFKHVGAVTVEQFTGKLRGAA